MRTFVLAVVACGAAAVAAPNPAFDKAQTLFAARNYAGTLKQLDLAQKVAGVERDVMLIILEQRGICHATLGNQRQAEEAFKMLLTLDPKRDLTKKYQGLAGNAAQAAKAWLAANAPLEASVAPAVSENGSLKSVNVVIGSDPFGLAKQVRFSVKAPGGGMASSISAIDASGRASAAALGPTVNWWAEVLGEKSAQLVLLGSAAKPLVATAEVMVPVAAVPIAAPAPVVVKPADPPKEASVVPAPSTGSVVQSLPAASTTVEIEPPTRINPVRVAGYVFLGAAVVSAAVGIGLGVSSSSTRSSLQADIMSGMNGSTWVDRNGSQMTTATVANVLFVAAGVLGVTGAVLWFLGPDLAVSPTANGVALSGRF